MVNSASLWKVSDNVFSSSVGSELVLMHADLDSYFSLNASGALIWSALSKPHSISELCALVSGAFEIEAEECAGDVRQLLADLQDKRLVQVSGKE